MDAHPDSALTLLNSLQTTILQEPEETQMYHRLLTVEARYKCYLPSTTDSLITIVTDYYQNINSKDKLMKAYYLKGCIYDELQDIPQALECYQQALQLSEGSQQYRTIALIYSQIGNVYLYQDMNNEAIPMFKKAYRYYEQNEDFIKMQNPTHNIARAYSELEEKDSAIHYYIQTYQLAKRNGDKSEEKTVLDELGGYYIYQEEYDSAFNALRASSNILVHSKPNYISWGLLYQHINRPDSAKYFFQKSLESKGTIYTTSGAYLHLAELEKVAGNYKEAYRLLRTHQQWQDSIKKITNTETAQRMHATYNYQRTEIENQRLKEANMQKELWLYKLGILVILIVAAGIRYRYYQKRKRQELMKAEKLVIEAKDKQYAMSLERISNNEQLISELKFKITQMEEEKLALIEREKQIRNEKEKLYTKSQEQMEESKQIIDNLKLELSQVEEEKQALIEAKVKALEATNNQIRSQQEERKLKIKVLRHSDIYKRFHASGLEAHSIAEQEWNELQQAIDQAYDNFTGQLYMLYPELSSIELRICCLIKIDIKLAAVSRLIARSRSTISGARRKLYEKIHVGLDVEKKDLTEKMDTLLREL